MKIVKIVTLFALLCLPLFAHAQLNLIPQPKKVLVENTYFSFVGKTIFDNKTLAAKDLQETINAEVETKAVLAKKESKADIVLKILKYPNEKLQIYEKLGIDSEFKLGNEGYILRVLPEKIYVLAETEAGVFYGVQTLKQIVEANRQGNKIPCLTIYDKPDFAVRGWQDDISRGPIPKLDFLKEQIKKMSAFKLNYFTLYTENVFKLKKHPDIAPNDGISAEEIRELSKFAQNYHVKLIGNYQSFGHMEKTLSLPKYKHLAENGQIISPVLPESYKFLDEVFSEIAPAYDSDYFNINCDETFGLGEGKSAEMVKQIGVDGVYLSHITKVNELLRKRGKRILMWGDIVASYPKIVPQLPQNITVIVWAYHPAKSFDYAITPISQHKINFWVAPGVNGWGNVFPDAKSAEINIYNFIRDGFNLGATGVLNTSWDDDGLNFFNDNWREFAWGAENSWNAPPNLEETASEKHRIEKYAEFNKAFDPIFYGLQNGKDISGEVLEYSYFHQSNLREVLKNQRFFEPVFPIFSDYVAEGETEKNESLLKKLDIIEARLKTTINEVKRNNQSLEDTIFAIAQTRFMLRKNLYRIKLNDYLNDKPNSLSPNELKRQKNDLIDELKLLKNTYIELWGKENRGYWLDKNEAKFDELLEHLEKLDGYCLIEPSTAITEKGRKISIRSIFSDLPIHFTLDGEPVTATSPKYSEPFFVKADVVVKAASISPNSVYPTAEKSLIYHKAIGKLLTLNSVYSQYHPSYDGGGKYGLVDGQLGDDKSFTSGRWQGYGGQDIDIELDLQNIEKINYFSMGFLQNTLSWVIFPPKVEIYAKNEASEKYQLIKTINGKTPPEAKGSLKENYTAEFVDFRARYLKIVAKYYGKLPEWHPAGSKYESMIFADEIILK